MGPQDPKEIARDLSALVGELASLHAGANQWLTDPEYVTLRQRLEATHAALVEARRRVRLSEGRGQLSCSREKANWPYHWTMTALANLGPTRSALSRNP
jgi:hypothetical protein